MALGLDVVDGDRRRRLASEKRILICGDIATHLRRQLQASGAKVVHVADIAAAIVRLATDGFDAILLDPGPDGVNLSLAKAVKFGGSADGIDDEILAAARTTHRMAPLFVLPLDGETEYGIIVFPPDLSFLEDGLELPLVNAVLMLDLGKLLCGRSALA